MSISPFEHPLLSSHFTQEGVAQHFSAEEEIASMLAFEAALAKAEAQAGVIPKDAAKAIEKCCRSLSVDLDDLRRGVANDGLIVPALVRQLRNSVNEEFRDFVHFGTTSQDLLDTSLVLRLSNILPLLYSQLKDILDLIGKLDREYGERGLMARTRMQRALPVAVSDRLRIWATPLSAQLDTLDQLKPHLLQIQFGGPVGNLDKLGDKGPEVRRKLAQILGLECHDVCWHTDRSNLVNFANWLSVLSGTLGKIGQDIALMAQNEINEIQFTGGGTSSAMPHKSNPVHAELLITLSRYNATQISAMHQALIHESERSGSSWCLEWMILPSMVTTTASGLKTAKTLFENIVNIGN